MDFLIYLGVYVGFALGCVAVWMFAVVCVLGIMKFNNWAAGIERKIQPRYR